MSSKDTSSFLAIFGLASHRPKATICSSPQHSSMTQQSISSNYLTSSSVSLDLLLKKHFLRLYSLIFFVFLSISPKSISSPFRDLKSGTSQFCTTRDRCPLLD